MHKILLFLLFLPNFLFSQNFSFLLQESEAKHLAVDQNFYWVGTDNSLYQYSKEDGQLCGIFNQSNSPITQVLVMDTDREGNLYVCTGSRLVRFEDFEWVDYGNCFQFTSGLVFNENNEVGSVSYYNYWASGNCVGNPLIGFSEVRRGLTFSYGRFNWYWCGGSSSGCGCGQSATQIRKMGNYFDDALLLSLPAYEEGHPDVLGNFWKSENNQLSTVFSPGGTTLYDTIESDTIFNLVSFTIQNHKVLENTSLGRFIYDGSNYDFLQSTLPFPSSASFEDYEHKMFYLSEDKTPFAYIDDEWIGLEKPEGIPFANLSLVNSRGDNLWFEHENEINFALVTSTDYSYFTPALNDIPDFIPSLKINNITNEIWRFYSETEELWRHNGTEWLTYQADDLSLEEWHLTEYKISENSNLWFPITDNPITFFAEFNFSTEDWTLHSDSLSYIENFIANTDFWYNDNEAFYHIIDQDTTTYPFPVTSNSNALKHINQSGHGWVSQLAINGAPVYYFDGENYIEADFFGGKPFRTISRNDTLYMLNKPEYENQMNTQIYYRKYVGEQLVYSHVLATPTTTTYPYFSSVYPQLFGFDENDDLIVQISVTWKTGLFSPPPVGYTTGVVTKKFSDNSLVPNPEFPQNYSIANAFFDNDRRLWSFNQNLGFVCPYPLTPQNFFFDKNGDCSMPNYLLAGTLQGGSPPFSYQWNDGDSLAYRLSVQEGNYAVSVNNTFGGTEVFQATIGTNSLIETETTITNVSEINATDGAIEISATSNFPPLFIAWNTSDSTFLINNLAAGNYEATITDTNGCELIENYTVSGGFFSIDVEVLQNIDCQGNDTGVAILNFPQSEPENYEILWSDGSTENTADSLLAGINFVTVFSYPGTTLIDTFYILDTSVGLSVEYETMVSSSESASDGTGTIFTSGGTLLYSFEWTDGTTNSTNEDLPVGTHYVTITDAGGCQITDSLTIYSQISVNITVLEQPLCLGDNTGVVEVEITGGTGNYEINITPSEEGLVMNLPAGLIVFTVNPEVGEAVSVEVLLEAINPPLQLGVETNYLNPGYQVSSTVSGGTPPFSYLWQTGDTTASLFVTDTIFSSLVTVTDSLGCSNSLGVNLDLPVISNINNDFTSNFQIFPNPTFDFINITLSEDIQAIQSLKIINIQGKEVLVDLVNESINLSKNISHLPAGVYYVLLENENQVLRGKFVKM